MNTQALITLSVAFLVFVLIGKVIAPQEVMCSVTLAVEANGKVMHTFLTKCLTDPIGIDDWQGQQLLGRN